MLGFQKKMDVNDIDLWGFFCFFLLQADIGGNA